MKTCARCKKEYEPTGTYQKYCGRYKLKTGCSWIIYRQQKQESAVRLRVRRLAKWHEKHPTTLLACARCGVNFKTRGSIDKYCGSKKYKTGCAWIVNREWNRAWEKAKYHRIKNTPEYIAKAKEHRKATYERIKDHYNFWAKNRQHRLRAASGDLKRLDWEALKATYNYTCASCNRKEPDIKLSIDHKIAIRFGGTHYLDNIQPLCVYCNRSKWCNTMFAACRLSDRLMHLVQYGDPVVRRSNVFYSETLQVPRSNS